MNEGGEHRIVVRDRKCIICRGRLMLCGKERCPVITRFAHLLSVNANKTLEGSTPPGVFVGRIGYPYVNIGPLLVDGERNSFFMDTPELWRDVKIDDLILFRSKLVRGKYRVRVDEIEKDRIVDSIRELGLMKKSVEAEAEFRKKPSKVLVVDSNSQPYGPSAPLKKFDPDFERSDRRIEKVYYDTDMSSREAVLWLFRKGVMVSSIQKAFSLGLFGYGKSRKFVPTRWSITAVDSIISEDLVENVKKMRLIDDYLVFEHKALDNRWLIIFIPSEWKYELVEAWYPGSSWNPFGNEIAICSSYERFEGRKGYPEIGGCYLAGRLAVAEKLVKIRRQAGVLILREVHSGYILPVGVWNVRENVRRAMEKKPKKFSTMKEVLEYIRATMEIPLRYWIENSELLKDVLYQRRIKDFIS